MTKQRSATKDRVPVDNDEREWEEYEQANPDDLEEDSGTAPEPTGREDASPDDLE